MLYLKSLMCTCMYKLTSPTANDIFLEAQQTFKTEIKTVWGYNSKKH